MIKSFGEAKILMLFYLNSTYKTEHGRCGWGLNQSKNISVTNTCEAILTYEQLDALADPILCSRKANLIEFLSKSLKTALNIDTPRIHDIAYPMLALSLLGVNEYTTDAEEKLFSLSNEDSGWPSAINVESCLVPTYHALFPLQKLGRPIDKKYYAWLQRLQTADGLCMFAPNESETSIGASSLVLYLLERSEFSREDWVNRLATAIKNEIPKLFKEMTNNSSSWVSYDSNTAFNIYGYGHALSALTSREENLFDLQIQNFIQTINFDNNTSFSIPAILELSIALRSIRSNFDPFHFFSSTTEQITQSLNADLGNQRSLIIEAEKKLQLQHALIDEWEKDIIRQRHAIPKLVISELISFLKTQCKKTLYSIVYYLFLFLLFYFPFKYAAEKYISGTFIWIDSYLIAVAIIPIVVELSRWRKKHREKASESSSL